MDKNIHNIMPQFQTAYEDQNAQIDDDVSYRNPLDIVEKQEMLVKATKTLEEGTAKIKAAKAAKKAKARTQSDRTSGREGDGAPESAANSSDGTEHREESSAPGK